jgi:hypothetical protein
MLSELGIGNVDVDSIKFAVQLLKAYLRSLGSGCCGRAEEEQLALGGLRGLVRLSSRIESVGQSAGRVAQTAKL